MKSFISLKKGNKKRLKGSVLIYSDFTAKSDEIPEEFEHILPCLYFSISPLDFAEKLKFSDEQRKSILEQHQAMSQLEKIVSQFAEKKILMRAGYVAPIIIKSESGLEGIDEDLLYTGNYNNLAHCTASLNMGMQLYVMHLEEQMEKRTGVDIEKLKRHQQDRPAQAYTAVPKEQFMRYIGQVFIGPMIDARRRKDGERFNALKFDFLRFSAGAAYFAEAEAAIEFIQNNGLTKRNLSVIQDYVVKIDAILREDYQAAAAMRDTIKEKLGAS